MLITKRSPLTGKENTLDLPVSSDQMNAYLYEGVVAQRAFPNLTADQREFIITGTLPGEWDQVVGEDE